MSQVCRIITLSLFVLGASCAFGQASDNPSKNQSPDTSATLKAAEANTKLAQDTGKAKPNAKPKASADAVMPYEVQHRSSCTYKSGNIPQYECCAKCHGFINLNPNPGTALPNVNVVFGATPSGFANPDQNEGPPTMDVDLANKTFNGSFQDNSNQTFSTQYVTNGIYTIRITAQLGHYFRANDWNCHYVCEATAESQIRISPTGVAKAKEWDESAEKKSLPQDTQQAANEPSGPCRAGGFEKEVGPASG